MTEREKRRAKRLNTIVINKTSLHDNDSSLHICLSPLESWELLARISKESWFLQTGTVAPDHLDKSKVTIFQRDKSCT